MPQSPVALREDDVDYRDPGARLTRLFDSKSLICLNDDDDSGVCAARGRMEGIPVLAYCTDARLMGGSMSSNGCAHIVEAIDTATEEGYPVIGLWHSGGARLAEGVSALDGVGSVFAAMVRASGRIPQLSIVLGPAAGGAAYGLALTDLVIMAPDARAFVTGPAVVRAVTGENIDMDGLGGPEPHSVRSGLVHMVAHSEADAMARTRRIISYVAKFESHRAEVTSEVRDLRSLLPESTRRAYDIRPLIRAILDQSPEEDGFEELQPKWAPNIVIGLGRLNGRTIGVVANNPLRKGGCLDSLSAEKAARFVRMCDSLGIPLLVLVDVPGYLPGVGQEWDGIIRRGAKLLHAFAESVVPRVTLIVRKSYGGAYIAMNSRVLGASAVFAWPEAEIAVMGAETAVEITHRRELAAVNGTERDSLRTALVSEHMVQSGGVERAVQLGSVDEVIEPNHTRRKLIEAFARLPVRRGSHGNIPL